MRKLTSSDLKNLNLLKHYRIIRKWVSKTCNLKEADLELLMYLDSLMLSADQIKKINYQLENKESTINKMDLYKIISREGLNTFDIHSFFISIKSSLRNII